ncbi:hypothetical protein DYB26_012381 [Aphanomyces astaci]|uniref:Protein kinase domain-containing protein n=1 Tax=Aphanomyces astaci TaxID=112090 RepID=A0A418FT59_APHAT|nr:hypothetical protein DYB26_012381 [Aphanomyces astaci]
MGNFCGGLWGWGGDDDGSTNDLKHSFKGPSSDSLLRTVQNPDVSSLIEIEHEAKRNFHDTFILGRKLGSGSFAMVYECGEIATKKTYACKVYDRRKLDAGALECALMEPFLLRRMYHPGTARVRAFVDAWTYVGILRCQGFYKEDDMYIMVMEELRGGDVFDKLQEIKGDIHERDVCRLVKMFLEALAYIHARNIVHRDLKLENLMLDSTSPTTSTLKIVDFGFAIQLPTKDATLTEVLGTPGYMAPEVIQGGPYGKVRQHHIHIVPTATAAELLEHKWFTQQLPPLPPSPRGATANTLKAIGPLRSFNRILRARVAAQQTSDDSQLRKLAEDKANALEDRPDLPPSVDLTKTTLLPTTRYNVIE